VRRPTLTWTPNADAAWYNILVFGSGWRLAYNGWFNGQTVCSGNSCSAQIPIDLSADFYLWYIQGSSIGGVGPWNNGMGFNVAATGPTGTVQAASPTLTWTKEPDSVP
jgi:hypothetical protein